MNELKKKVGPLELWQWIAIVGGGALAYYLYERKKSSSEVNPEEEEKLLGALSKAGGGGGEGNTGSIGSTTAAPAAEGPKGEVGPAGGAGNTGPQGEAPSAGLENQVAGLEAKTASLEQKLNKPPATSHTSAAQALPKGYVKNSKGEAYRTVVKGKNIFHEYLNRKGPSKVLKVGTVHRTVKPAKRARKPKPIHKKITVKKAPAKHTEAKKEKKKEPVHR
jgi:hypothetical protein